MIRLYYNCSNCGANDEVDDITNLDGCCPVCHEHHGEISYGCMLKANQFILELSKMTENEIAKYSEAINIAAKSLVYDLY